MPEITWSEMFCELCEDCACENLCENLDVCAYNEWLELMHQEYEQAIWEIGFFTYIENLADTAKWRWEGKMKGGKRKARLTMGERK